MEGITAFVLGGAVALTARSRIVPVSKALVTAGFGIAKAAKGGLEEIGRAAVSGQKQEARTEVPTPAEKVTATKGGARTARGRRTAETA